MFFGKRDKREPDRVPLDELESLEASLFEQKLDNLEPRAKAALDGVRAASAEFSRECDRLYELDAEPYVQDLYFPNINGIKNQKGFYAKALKHAIERLRLEPDGAANIYDRYNDMLSEVDRVANEVLSVNANYKTILYCYSRHMPGMKRAFATIERNRDGLREEITKRSGTASAHSRITERITALRSLLDDSRALKEGSQALSRDLSIGDKEAAARQEAEILKEISGKRSEISSISEAISKHSSDISRLTLPLERPSRKLDHIMVRKRSLHAMLADAAGSITSSTDNDEFLELIRELKKNIENGSIEVKNRDGTLETVSELLGSDMYSMVESFKALQQRRSDLERDIRVLEGVIVDIKKGKSSAEKAKEEIRRMEGMAEEMSTKVAPAKAELESMFLQHYNKSLLIIL